MRVSHTRLLAAPSHKLPQTPRPFALHRSSLTLLSRLCSAIPEAEPILVVGETDAGKTTSLQYLGSLLARPLVAVNLSNQTASAEPMGGFKPVDARVPASELQLRFGALFAGTFSTKKNGAFLLDVRADVTATKWKRVVKMWNDACKRVKAKFDECACFLSTTRVRLTTHLDRRWRTSHESDASSKMDWTLLLRRLGLLLRMTLRRLRSSTSPPSRRLSSRSWKGTCESRSTRALVCFESSNEGLR